MQTTILVVEDDQFFARVIERWIKNAGYAVLYCKNTEEGLTAFCEGQFDLCLFSINMHMPKHDGYQLALSVRAMDQGVPIIFMSFHSREDDRVHGFEVGCDDYLTKPFNLEELVFRIKVWLKRSKQFYCDRKIVYELGDLTFDPLNLFLINKITGTKIQLSPKEGKILAFLCEHANETLTREFVLVNLWKLPDFFACRCLDVYVARLRKHLNTASTARIETFRKIGTKGEAMLMLQI